LSLEELLTSKEALDAAEGALLADAGVRPFRIVARSVISSAVEAAKPDIEEEERRIRESLEEAIKRLRKVGVNEVHQLSIEVRRQVASELEELLAQPMQLEGESDA
jgi:nucleotide-binding universal stress UspA family protein